jgi:hypothetical protein
MKQYLLRSRSGQPVSDVGCVVPKGNASPEIPIDILAEIPIVNFIPIVKFIPGDAFSRCEKRILRQ